MQYRQLGSSDLHVCEIALGSWLTYGGGVEKARALAYMRRSIRRSSWKAERILAFAA